MTRNTMVGSLMLLVAVAVAAAGERQPVYKTPQAVYEASGKAMMNKDWKAFCSTLCDETRDFLAISVAGLTLTIKDSVKSAPKEKREKTLAELKPSLDVLDRYGVTIEPLLRLKSQKIVGGPGAKEQATIQAMKQLLEPVKDRCAFFAELFAAVAKQGKKKAREGPVSFKGELKDVQIEGDKARAVIVSMKDGKEKRDPIGFRRIGAGWKIDMPSPFGKGRK